MLRRFSCLIILKGSQCVIGTARFLPVAVSYESQQGNDMTYLRSQLLGNSGQVYGSGTVVTESEQAFDFHQIIWNTPNRHKNKCRDHFKIMLYMYYRIHRSCKCIKYCTKPGTPLSL